MRGLGIPTITRVLVCVTQITYDLVSQVLK